MEAVELKLTFWQRYRLQRQLQETQDARIYRRTLAVLEVSRGSPVAEVARRLGVTRRSVYNWIEEYAGSRDPKVLWDCERSGRPSVWTSELRDVFEEALTQRPDKLGYSAISWTVPLLRTHLEQHTGQSLSEDTIRRELARMDRAWKRSRHVLPPDPEEEKKTPYSPTSSQIAASERLLGRG